MRAGFAQAPQTRAGHVPKAVSIKRRNMVALTLTLPLWATAVEAKDLKEAMLANKERKEKLHHAAEDMEKKGKAAPVFADSSYAVSEDKTPNIHTRQGMEIGMDREDRKRHIE